MRTAMLALLALSTLIPSLGCVGARGASGQCQTCEHGRGCVRNGFIARTLGAGSRYDKHVTPTEEGMGAPSSAQVAYPYYTTRGPRDFLMNNPPSIGY